MHNSTYLKFSPSVKCIEDAEKKRFLLINCRNEKLDYYPVFDYDERDLLNLQSGVSMNSLQEMFSNKKADQYIGFFQRNGYFDQLEDGILFTDRIRKNNENYCRSRYYEIYKDIENKLKIYNSDQSIPWSNYSAPPNIASIEVCFLITDICNLKCKYCHVIDNIELNQRKVSRKIMTEQMLVSFTKQFIIYIKNRFNIGCLKICFFGGQPALKGKVRNFLYRAADYISKEGAKQKIYIKFAIDDNGTQVDNELIKFYKQYGFQVSLSFDAPEDVNSIQRPFPGSNRKSGVIVEENLKRLIDNEVDVGLRATVTNHNQSRILEAIKKYSNWGLTAAAFVPMQDVAHGKKVLGITSPEPEVFGKELIKTFNFVLELYETKKNLFDFGPITALLHSIVSGGTTQPCGMGDNYFAVNPTGDIYTCHRDLIPEYYVCNLNDSAFLKKMNAIPENQKCPSFYSMIDPNTLCSDKLCACKKPLKTNCSECEVLIFCGGLCPAASIAQYGCINRGVSILLDSDPSYGEDRCRWSKELISHFLWQYLDAENNSLIKKYTREIFS